MRLINYENFELKVADEAFLMRPVRELFEADKSRRKEVFWQQMGYMYFMVDPRSPYMYITDDQERSREVKLQEGLADDWEPSKKLKSAMEQYAKVTITTSALVLQSARKTIDNLRRFLESVDLLATDDHGKPIYQVSAVTTALKQIPEIARVLNEAENALAKDMSSEDTKARGSVAKSMYEDEEE